MSAKARREVVITNDLGMHLRAAGVLVQLAGRYRAEIVIERDGMQVDGKSIMSVLSLAAGKGSKLCICASGDDAEEAAQNICELIERGFGISP